MTFVAKQVLYCENCKGTDIVIATKGENSYVPPTMLGMCELTDPARRRGDLFPGVTNRERRRVAICLSCNRVVEWKEDMGAYSAFYGPLKQGESGEG